MKLQLTLKLLQTNTELKIIAVIVVLKNDVHES